MSPRATYRLQFRNGMTFARAAELVPYLARLGVSHLYASPVFQAVAGSTHGYDLIRYDRVDPALGDEADFDRMAEAARRRGLKLLMDIVPNHMGATADNPWWRDVLEWGERSQFAQSFDVDWKSEKIIIPRLGEPYGEALGRGAFTLRLNADVGTIDFLHDASWLPLSPPTYARALDRSEDERLKAIAHRFLVATPETTPEIETSFAEALRDAGFRSTVEVVLDEFGRDRDRMHDLHEAQPWRLTFWRAAREQLTYRRFFEISELIGVRVEQPSVFEDAHALVLRWVEEGKADGLRIDHIDGLADPKAYLDRLKSAIGEDHPCPVLVEKILGPDEMVRRDWPIDGTTGYEFMRAIGGILTDAAGKEPLNDRYQAFAGEVFDYRRMLGESKRRVLVRNLAGELDVLTGQAHALAQRDLNTRDFGRDTLRRALVEISVALPVYRTYVDIDGPRAEDDRLIFAAAETANKTREVENERAMDFIAGLWRLNVNIDDRVDALAFVTRLQQTTGPLMAKAIEDTLFYRYNRLLALNEVGGEPDAFGVSIARFHEEMQERLASQPRGLVATATHDTKRGEDARARLYVISEAADLWGGAAERWRETNASLKTAVESGPAPSANDEWMYYQALLGAWPIELAPDDADGLENLADRMAPFMQKALREAKVHSTWTAPDEAYEGGVEAFVRATLDSAHSEPFLADFHALSQRFVIAGALNSFAQTLLKTTVPGVPDIYQGSELWDFSLVDPDNRRDVDFVARATLLASEPGRSPDDLVSDWKSGAIKLRIIRAALARRAEAPDLFTTGAYEPLETEGPHKDRLLGFRRDGEVQSVIVIVPRLPRGLLGDADAPLISPDAWADTSVLVGSGTLRNLLTGRDHAAEDGRLAAMDVLGAFPVALLTRTN